MTQLAMKSTPARMKLASSSLAVVAVEEVEAEAVLALGELLFLPVGPAPVDEA